MTHHSVPPPPLSKLSHLRMHNAHMPRQRIVPAKSLLLTAVLAPDLPLRIIMDRVLMPRKIVRA